MGLQFEHIFASERVRRREVNRQALVNGRALRIGEGQVQRLARRQGAPEQQLHQGNKAFATYPHNAHRAAPGGGGNGQNRVVVTAQHRGGV